MAQRSKVATPTMKRRFWVALENAGLSQSQWADQHGYSSHHVGEVVANNRVSFPVRELVATFIKEQERAIAARVKVPATL